MTNEMFVHDIFNVEGPGHVIVQFVPCSLRLPVANWMLPMTKRANETLCLYFNLRRQKKIYLESDHYVREFDNFYLPVGHRQICQICQRTNHLGADVMVLTKADELICVTIKRNKRYSLDHYYDESRPPRCYNNYSARAITISILCDKCSIIVHSSTK